MKKLDLIIILILVIAPIFLAIAIIPTMNSNGDNSVSFLNKFQKKIGVITVEGVIYNSKTTVNQIKTFRKDSSIEGLIIHVNSPGGAVAPSQEIYQEILKYREVTGKPVFISMGTVAASGGYYIAAAGDRIFANSGTLTGSIGVIMQFSHYSELLKKIGVDVSTITAGKLKDAGSPYRELRSNEKGYFDALLKDTHEQFIKDVAEGRDMNIDSLRLYTEGEIFTGNMAHSYGLVDTIATYEETKSAMLEHLGLPSSTDFVAPVQNDKSGLELLLGSKSSLNKISSTIFPKSGMYFLATELQ